MDQRKTGKYIAELRHKDNLTQEMLGQKLGVTNKTISRWENGTYMPGVEILQELSKVFHVSINELLSGEYLTDLDFREKADENIVGVYKSSSFTLKEQSAFWKHKWLNAHIALILFCALILGGLFIWAWHASILWISGACPLLCIAVYMVLHNRMMIYIEDKIYSQNDNGKK